MLALAAFRGTRRAAQVTAKLPEARKRFVVDGGLVMRLAGKVALISGGARGMGAVEARLFSREGAKVVLGDVLDTDGGAVEAEIGKAGGEAVYLRLDVTREADWKNAVETAVRRFGNVSTMIERDANIPPLEELCDELNAARALAELTLARAA